ncbi:MAG: YitT family protein [Methanocorpusculum parvum]|nr:YitT family protein [Methanocorpusculum parvum]
MLPIKRILIFIAGLYCMGLGVALSVIAALGTSPISCFPYVVSEIAPVSVGTVTFIMNFIFLLAQIAILKKDFKPWQILQLPALLVFSVCIDMNILLFSWLPGDIYLLQVLWMLLGCLILGTGIGLLLLADYVMMPADYLVRILAFVVLKKDFGKVKVTFDLTLVCIAAITSLIFLHEIVGIREGSLIAALTVGLIARTVASKLSFLQKTQMH